MLNGFDTQTAPLTEAELASLPILKSRLLQAYGKDNAVYNDELQRITGLSSARVRKCINLLRTSGEVKCLLASSKGYYISENEEEMKAYEESLLGRELAIRQVRESIANQRQSRFCGGYQGKLF